LRGGSDNAPLHDSRDRRTILAWFVRAGIDTEETNGDRAQSTEPPNSPSHASANAKYRRLHTLELRLMASDTVRVIAADMGVTRVTHSVGKGLNQTHGALPDAIHSVGVELAVSTDEGEILLHRLSDQQPVEGIAMVEGQLDDAHHVAELDRQKRNAVGGQLLFEKLRQGPVQVQALQADLMAVSQQPAMLK
jgi:hypothetical protein